MSVSVFTKTVAELSLISKGQRITARSLNEPRRAINTMLSGVTPPQQVEVPAQPSAGEPAIAVVLVEAPSLPDPPEDEGSSILKIRRVKYEAEPPVPEQYAWDGEAFDAYPAFGLTVGDFVGLEWPFTTRIPDVDQTTFLKARLVSGAWLVDWPTPITAQFKFDEMSSVDNYFFARTWDGSNLGRRQIVIAMPPSLRNLHGQTRDGVIYVQVQPSLRFSRRGTINEVEIIIPTYTFGDIIYAERPIRGGVGVLAFPNALRAAWLDDNRASRAWARQFDDDAAV